MGVKYIESRRNEIVKVEAKRLFDAVVAHVIVQTPNNEYVFTVDWDQRANTIDDMILERTKDLFQEIGTLLVVHRSSSKVVHGKLIEIVADQVIENKLPMFYWSRVPGKFVNKLTGQEVTLNKSDGSSIFDGTVREWYETFMETLIDAGNSIHRVAKEAPESIYVPKDLHCILESSILYRPSFNELDPYAGLLSSRFKVYVDESLPKDTAIVVLAKNGIKYVAEVKVLDLNII